MSSPASRLISLIMLLQRQPNQKAGDLAVGLRVSVRTLHRYITQLDEMGIPIYAERGPYGGFSLVRGYKLPPLVFSPEEAAAISLGASLVEEMWGKLYRAAAHSALAKLENLLPETQREEVSWARRSLVSSGLYPPGLDAQAAILEQLRSAMHASRQVEIVYSSATAVTSSRRRLDPYALVFRWGWWYVVGFCHNRRELRTFRIDRIQELTALQEAFEPPLDFDARAFISREPVGQPQVYARLKFSKQAASIARLNRPNWESFEEQPDGSVVVTSSAPDLNWAASTSLAYGPLVEVLDPPELRILLRDWAQALVEIYSKGE